MNTTDDHDVGFVIFMLWSESLIALGLALAIVIYQLYLWLRVGQWTPISLVRPLAFLEIDWAISPTDWRGFHRILDAIPLSLFVFLWGLPSAAFLLRYYRARR